MQESVKDILIRLKLLKYGKIKNAAVVLYAKKIQSSYSQCMIKMTRFKGISKLDNFIDNQQVYGNAFKILSEANEFMMRRLNISSSFEPDSFVSVDKFTVPELAVREALINAICHRNYQSTAAIYLAIFDDRLEIWNNGFLPKELKLEDLKEKHESYPRNKLIARTFYKIGLIERWGTGTIKMIDECRKHGIPDPIFEEYTSGLSVQFIFEEPIGPRAGKVNQKHHSDKVIQEASPLEKLSKRQLEILKILGRSEGLKAVEIKDQLLDPPAERTLREDLFELKKFGLIDSRGRARATIWFLRK